MSRVRSSLLILATASLLGCGSGDDSSATPATDGQTAGTDGSGDGGSGQLDASGSGPATMIADSSVTASGDSGVPAYGNTDAGRPDATGGQTVEAGPAADAGRPTVGPVPEAALRAKCTGTDPIECHFGGEPGNYDVSIVLGGVAAGSTVVQAERTRVMLAPITTAAAETKRFTFTVNVRQPEGEPIQDVPAGSSGLDLYFLGNSGMPPQLQAIGYASARQPIMLYIAGDSTVCDQPTLDYGGWGQQLPQYFDYPVSVANYADSGESSASFLGSKKLFGAIEPLLKPNDWVLVQFGHNDKTNTAANFHDNLTALVTRVKAKGALPVLITPVARAQFDGKAVSPQHINSTGANLPEIVAQVGSEQKVPVLDLTARTVDWLTELGPTGWKPYHALGTDATHTNPAGAAAEAGFVRDLIVQAKLTGLIERMR